MTLNEENRGRSLTQALQRIWEEELERQSQAFVRFPINTNAPAENERPIARFYASQLPADVDKAFPVDKWQPSIGIEGNYLDIIDDLRVMGVRFSNHHTGEAANVGLFSVCDPHAREGYYCPGCAGYVEDWDHAMNWYPNKGVRNADDYSDDIRF